LFYRMNGFMISSFFSEYGFDIDFDTWRWDWTLEKNSSIVCHILICVFYAVSVKVLQIYVKSQKAYIPPSWIEPFRFVHNVSLAAVSFIMFVVMVMEVARDGRFNSWSDAACRVTPNVGLYGFINFIYLVSKLWEWIDTYLLVLTSKPVIVLHWFHHMTTFGMAALVHSFPVGAFAWINCLVHAVMYMHYAKPVRWARPFITSGQLIQFVIVLSIHLTSFFNPDTCFDARPLWMEWAFNFIVVFGFFFMFVLFFIQEYIVGKEGKKSSKSKVSKKE
jgi:hypothetical protein